MRFKNILGAVLLSVFSGVHFSGLLLFLNPHIPLKLSFVTPLFAVFSVFFFVLFSIVWFFTSKTSFWFYLKLPQAITLILTAQALSCWFNAFYYSFFLPPGVNQRLLKAAIALSVASLICFYTALLRHFRFDNLNKKLRVVFVLFAVISVYIVLERREAYRPHLRAEPKSTIYRDDHRVRIYVIGIEAATLDAILPLEEQGHLPFFSRILKEGSQARIQPLLPIRRLPLWTSLSTGKYPYKHGVLGEFTYHIPLISNKITINLLPLGFSIQRRGTLGLARAIDFKASNAKPVWDILSDLKIPAVSIGWPLSASSNSNLRIILSEDFFTAGENKFLLTPELRERAQLFQTKKEELSPLTTSRFGVNPPDLVLNALVQDLWRRDLFSFLIDTESDTETVFMVLPGLTEISKSYYGGYSAVQFDASQEPTAKDAALILRAYYIHLDEILAQVWARRREPSVLVVVSPHGTTAPSGWRKILLELARRPPVEGYVDQGSDGLLMFLGEGIKHGTTLRSAEVVDLAPTLLYLLKLPIARDLDGSVLTSTFETKFLAHQPLTFMSSYETIPNTHNP